MNGQENCEFIISLYEREPHMIGSFQDEQAALFGLDGQKLSWQNSIFARDVGDQERCQGCKARISNITAAGSSYYALIEHRGPLLVTQVSEVDYDEILKRIHGNVDQNYLTLIEFNSQGIPGSSMTWSFSDEAVVAEMVGNPMGTSAIALRYRGTINIAEESFSSTSTDQFASLLVLLHEEFSCFRVDHTFEITSPSSVVAHGVALASYGQAWVTGQARGVLTLESDEQSLNHNGGPQFMLGLLQ